MNKKIKRKLIYASYNIQSNNIINSSQYRYKEWRIVRHDWLIILEGPSKNVWNPKKKIIIKTKFKNTMMFREKIYPCKIKLI